MYRLKLALLLLPILIVLSLTAASVPVGEWPDWRGPERDGVSKEKNLPDHWSPAGDNLAWKAPYGARSAPIVLGDHLYLQNAAGQGVTLQERVLCLNADTGKLLWEHKFNVFLSDVPPHRVGWASPVADPATGNVYAYGVGGTVLGLTKEGKLLFERSITEDFGLFTTHGGRTVSPVIDGDLLIVSGPTSTWGAMANRSHRFMAFDKRNGETMWVSTPGGRPYDTTYSPPIIPTVNGMRLLIAGAGDGAVHALKPQTGEPVWRYEAAKRGINTAVVMNGNTALVSHSEENLDSSEMGLLAAIDATAKGKVGPAQVKWSQKGFQGGYSSPIVDGDRVYQVDNGANLFAFDVVGGRQLWKQNLGTIQKASPVLGDGKLYVGTESGKFYILKPHNDRCEVLSAQALGTEAAHVSVIGSAAIARGRVYFASSETVYAIGKNAAVQPQAFHAENLPAGQGPPAWVQVVPTELILKPGESVQLRARLFDQQGRFLRENKADWSLEQLKGTVADGKFTSASDKIGQAGMVKATVGGVSGAARVRVIPPLPWNEDFESMPAGAVPPQWVSAVAGKFAVQDLDGSKVLAKAPDPSLFKRMRVFMGPDNWSNYTVEADVRSLEKRRQMGDLGIIAQRYELVLFGNSQRLDLQPWEPETTRTVKVPFAWKADTWYHMKLRVENGSNGKTRILGKAWAKGEAEPKAWLIDHIDPIPNKQGSPGIYADAQNGAFFDNLKVVTNQ